MVHTVYLDQPRWLISRYGASAEKKKGKRKGGKEEGKEEGRKGGKKPKLA